MKKSNFIHPEIKACVLAECIQEGYFGQGIMEQEYAEIILKKYPSVSPRSLSRIAHDFYYPPIIATTTSTSTSTTSSVVKKRKRKRKQERSGRPIKITKHMSDMVNTIGQQYCNNYEICSAAEMHRRLNLLQIGSVSYDTVRRYLKYYLQQEQHEVRFFLVDGSNPRYNVIEQNFNSNNTGEHNNTPRYHYSTQPIVHSKSRPKIMLWGDIHCPNHFLPPEYEAADGIVQYNACGGQETFELVPVSMPVKTSSEEEWSRVVSGWVIYSMEPVGRTLRKINEDEDIAREHDYLCRK